MTRTIAWATATLTRRILTRAAEAARGTEWEDYLSHAGIDVARLSRSAREESEAPASPLAPASRARL